MNWLYFSISMKNNNRQNILLLTKKFIIFILSSYSVNLRYEIFLRLYAI